MSSALVDTSVLIKWFHDVSETEVEPARALRDAHIEGRFDAFVLDLGIYEVGNVLAQALKWPADQIAAQLADLLAIIGPPLVMDSAWVPVAAEFADRHQLSFYDAAWAATAHALGIPLVSADQQLVSTGLAVNATSAAKLLLTP